MTKQKNKTVEQHYAWKKEKDMPGHRTSAKHDKYDRDEHGNLICPKYLSNHIHYSPTDPDARVSVKPGKARQLNYFA